MPKTRALVLLFILLGSMPIGLCAFAEDPMFTVDNVTVDVTAENAIAAREKAFEDAQVKAFQELATRMLPEEEAASFKTPEPLTISTMIQDFELTNEKLSAVRYVGTYQFRFKDSAVRRYFSRAAAPPQAQAQTDYASPPPRHNDVSIAKNLLILPFLEAGGRTFLWSPYNGWMSAWNRAGSLKGPVSVDLPLGDLQDVREMPDEAALTYNPANLRALTSRYGAGEAIIAIAHPDSAFLRVDDDNQTALGGMGIDIYRTDQGRPTLAGQINVAANGVQTKGQLYDSAVQQVFAALQTGLKAAPKASKTVGTNALQVVIPISSLQQWSHIQSNLKSVYGIDDAVLKSLTPRQAVVDLVYQGNSDHLMTSLQQAGMSLEQGSGPGGQAQNILNVTSPYRTRL
ncbi:MAG: DUF2066 domain-containing protein [Bdellovibrionales bacterium]